MGMTGISSRRRNKKAHPPSNLSLLQQEQAPKNVRIGAGRCPTVVGLLAKFAGGCGAGECGGGGDGGDGSNLLFQQHNSNLRRSQPVRRGRGRGRGRRKSAKINLVVGTTILLVTYIASDVYLVLSFNKEEVTSYYYETVLKKKLFNKL